MKGGFCCKELVCILQWLKIYIIVYKCRVGCGGIERYDAYLWRAETPRM